MVVHLRRKELAFAVKIWFKSYLEDTCSAYRAVVGSVWFDCCTFLTVAHLKVFLTEAHLNVFINDDQACFHCYVLSSLWNWAVITADKVFWTHYATLRGHTKMSFLLFGVWGICLIHNHSWELFWTTLNSMSNAPNASLTAPWMVRIATGKSLSITICSSNRFWTWR